MMMLGIGRSGSLACVSEPILCDCGEVLVAGADANGITMVDGTYIVFQRRTDYVACQSCLRSYPVRDLLQGRGDRPEPVEQLERLLGGGAALAEIPAEAPTENPPEPS